MFHSLNEFLKIWEYESDSTLKLFRLLTDDALQQKVNEGGRTLGRLANHIIETLSEMPHRLGLPIAEQQADFHTAAEIVQAYEKANNDLMAALKANWSDADLEKETNMYGEHWKNGYSLFVLLTHQAHHRGQITVLMRQAGLPVIGVYGPAKEEWAQMNMPAMA